MKVKDIRDLTNDELRMKLQTSKEELFTLRFQLATNQLDNPMKVREVKKNIARIQTIIRERELRLNQA